VRWAAAWFGRPFKPFVALDFRFARGRLWRLLGRAYRSPRGLHQPGFRRRGFRFDHDVLPRNNGPRILVRCALLLRPCSRVQAKAADPVPAPSGTLRAAYIGPNVAQARLDPVTGTISGAIADIARDLRRRDR
jgi:hypothetical protein